MTNAVEIRGIDTDNYDGQVPVAHFQRLFDVYAVRFNIIGLEVGMPFAKDQLLASNSAGIDVPFAYKFLYGHNDDIERLKQAAGFGKPVAIDIEAELNLGVPANIQRMHEGRDALVAEGLFWGWYSSPNFWQEKTANTMDFAGDFCWTATYPFIKMPPPVSYLPDFSQFPGYGGLIPQVWQYSNTCYEDKGHPWAFDMNAYQYPDTPAPPAPPVRQWLYGNEQGGLEKRGFQQVIWNNWVETDLLGDLEGKLSGQHWHNIGGTFIKLAD